MDEEAVKALSLIHIYVVKRELLEEDEDDVETAQSRHKMEKLEALDKISLTKTVMNVVKPEMCIRDRSMILADMKQVDEYMAFAVCPEGDRKSVV